MRPEALVSKETNPIGNLRHLPETGSYGPFYGLPCQDLGVRQQLPVIGFWPQATSVNGRMLMAGRKRPKFFLGQELPLRDSKARYSNQMERGSL